MFYNTINTLGRYVHRKAAVYDEADEDIPQPLKTFLLVLFGLVVALMTIDGINWKPIARYGYFAFELLVFVAFIVIVGALFFIVLPAFYN